MLGDSVLLDLDLDQLQVRIGCELALATVIDIIDDIM